MEIDKTALTHDVAKAVWASLDPMGIEAPFEEQNSMVQFNVKAQVLPVITHTLPVAERHTKQAVLDKIKFEQDNGLSAEEIIQALQKEMSS